ncbi:unnamed protein product [Echinostoma caproni]|uniref:RRM domain-containing protein n=1 Tax=Echinostoma caproni TaxID=27848 RepID=A0A183AKA2_9TREM|nr:unnamed protein product [Echinostoma caproni]
MVVPMRAPEGALLEMVHLDSARDMLGYYSSVYPPRIRGKLPVRLSYSKYPVLNTIPPSQAITEAISLANQRHVDVVTPPHCVILAQVEHAPPSMHFGYRQFHQLFKDFGRILRIISFRSGPCQKALVEFDEPVSAVVAVMQADGTVFKPDDGPSDLRCTIRVELSRQSSLEIRQEDENCRDFTRESTPHRRMSEPVYASPGNGAFRPYRQMDHPNSMESMSPSWSNVNVLDLVTEDRLNNLDPNTLSELASRMVKPLLKAALIVGGQQSTFLKSQAEVLEHLCPQNVRPMLQRSQPTPLLSGFSSSSHSMSMLEEPSKTAQSSVVYVTNLNQEVRLVTYCTTLYRRGVGDISFIFTSSMHIWPKSPVDTSSYFRSGVYGDVQRIKLMHSRKDAALIQFTDATQAKRAVKYLDSVPLYGKVMRCSLSKNASVNIPPAGSKDPATGDEISAANNRVYTDSRLHRFRNASSRSLQNICPPSRVLYVSQLSDQVSEEDLIDVFSRISGHEPEVVKLVRIAKPMALVQMKNLEEAVAALVALDDYEIDDNTRIRVCFSKSPIRQ